MPLKRFSVLFLAALALGVAFPATAQAQLDNPRARYSLYYEAFRGGDYDTALPHLRWLLANDPLFTGGQRDGRNIRRAITLYDSLAARSARAGDMALAQAYADTSFQYLDRYPTLMQGADVEFEELPYMLNRALFLQRNAQFFPDRQGEILEIYRDAFERYPDELDDYYLVTLFNLEYEDFSSRETDTDEREAWKERITEQYIARLDDQENIDFVQGVLDSIVVYVSPFISYRDLYNRYRAEGPEGFDEEEFQQLIAFLNLVDDTRGEIAESDSASALRESIDENLLAVVDSDVNVDQFKQEVLAEMISRLPPSYGLEMARGNYAAALELASNNEQRQAALYNWASAQFRAGNRSAAYQTAGRALQYGNHGPSLYIRASVVAGTLRGGSLTNAAGAWCVADLFSQAAAAGGATAGAARRAAARYARSGPSRQQYIYEGWRPGMRVTGSHGYGSCTTTVR